MATQKGSGKIAAILVVGRDKDTDYETQPGHILTDGWWVGVNADPEVVAARIRIKVATDLGINVKYVKFMGWLDNPSLPGTWWPMDTDTGSDADSNTKRQILRKAAQPSEAYPLLGPIKLKPPAELAQRYGAEGGRKAAQRMTAQQRTERARKAATARYAKEARHGKA